MDDQQPVVNTDAQLKTFGQKMQADISVLWQNNKIFLITFGLLILIVKFRDVIIDVLVGSSKRTLDNAVKTDQTLKTQEDEAKATADKLVDDAKKMSENKPKVDEDWNLKK